MCVFRCKNVYDFLSNEDFDVAFISSAMEQSERNKIMKQLRNFGVKILVSTDLVIFTFLLILFFSLKFWFMEYPTLFQTSSEFHTTVFVNCTCKMNLGSLF